MRRDSLPGGEELQGYDAGSSQEQEKRVCSERPVLCLAGEKETTLGGGSSKKTLKGGGALQKRAQFGPVGFGSWARCVDSCSCRTVRDAMLRQCDSWRQCLPRVRPDKLRHAQTRKQAFVSDMKPSSVQLECRTVSNRCPAKRRGLVGGQMVRPHKVFSPSWT
jgi:hypothetical protein